MVKGLNPARMRKRAQFGNLVRNGKVNPNTGRATQGFAESFSLWYGDYTLTLSQRLAYHGLDKDLARVIFIRHNPQITEVKKVQIDNVLYDIQEVQADDGLTADGFDLVALKKVVSNA